MIKKEDYLLYRALEDPKIGFIRKVDIISLKMTTIELEYK